MERATKDSGWAIPDSIATEAPWRWLAAGWADIWRNPLISLGYGAVFVLAGFGLSYLLWQAGLSAFIPVTAGSFALIGPLMAVGLYELSRRYERGETFTLSDIVFVKTASPIHIAYVGFLILFGLLVWVRIATLLYALFISGTYMPISKFSEFVLGTPQGLTMLVVGSIIGGFIAFTMYALTVFSIPMLMDRKTDILEATVKSFMTVMKNKAAMLLWAWLIAVFVAIGLATAFIGLVVVFPLLGHATWHAYRDVFGTAD
jgi:uncharacterized membrane protein